MVRKRSNSFTKSLRDYIVPLIGLGLIGLLIYSLFYNSGTQDTQDTIKYENQIGLEVTLDNDITESYIVYPWENKKKIEGAINLYKWERILVKEWSVSVVFPSVWNLKLDKNGDMKYEEDGSVSLLSSDLWLDNETELNVNLQYGKVIVEANSHISFSQNEVESSVYLLSGSAEVRNLAWVSSPLWVWQKIIISRLNASLDTVDMSLYKDELDDFFLTSDWFIKNNGSRYIWWNNDETGTGTNSVSSSASNILSFHNFVDESYVSSSSINITGNYIWDEVARISLNWVEAKLSSENSSFLFEAVDVSSRENDMIFKVYDDANDLLSKFLYVVYYSSGEADSSNNSLFNVKNYAVDGSLFTFTSPNTKDTFSTFSSFVTIKGKVLAKGIKKVSVNGYFLKSFNGNTWRYHADVRYNNLRTGTNVYEIKYFDEDDNVVYANNFTIIKKPIGSTSIKVPVYSDEAQIQ